MLSKQSKKISSLKVFSLILKRRVTKKNKKKNRAFYSKLFYNIKLFDTRNGMNSCNFKIYDFFKIIKDLYPY
jgi:hypothetical protein